MVELRILRGGNEAKSTITSLDFKRADFTRCRELFEGIPWHVVPERSREDSQFCRITFIKLENSPSQSLENQTKVIEGLH